MNFEEYKGKLSDIKSSLDSLARIKDKEYQNYREFLNNRIDVPLERRQEMIGYLGKMQKEDEKNINNQIAFIELLLDQVYYKKIVEDVLEKLGIQKATQDKTTQLAVNNVIQENGVKEDWKNRNASMMPQSQDNSSYNTNTNHERISTICQKFMVNYFRFEKLQLSVADEYVEELGNLDYASWLKYEEKEKITLVSTTKPPKYYAYDACNCTDKVKKGEYYFLIPATSFGFTETTMVKAAVMTFFDLRNYNGSNAKPKVIKPACVKKEGDIYRVCEKGILEF